MAPIASLEVPALSLGWIDTVGLVIVGVMLLLGAFRGLWWQVIRLLGLFAAVVLARALSPRLAPPLVEALPDLPPRVGYGLVWLAVFLAGLAVAALLGSLGKRLLSTMKLGLVDRAGGALLGVATGALVHVAFVAVLCQLAPEPWVARHVGATFSESALGAVGARWSAVVGTDAGAELERVFSRDPAPTPPSSSDGGPGGRVH